MRIDSSGWVLQHAEVGRALSGSLLVGQLLTNQFRASTATARSSLIIAGVKSLPPSSSFAATLLRFIFVEIPVPAFGAGRSAVPHLPLAISLHTKYDLVTSTLVYSPLMVSPSFDDPKI